MSGIITAAIMQLYLYFIGLFIIGFLVILILGFIKVKPKKSKERITKQFLKFVIALIGGKGTLGEYRINSILADLSDQDYVCLNDIMIENGKGTSQIDHIIISKYGIFVIETKFYSGIITGSEYGEKWTKNVYGHKYRFRNPLKQNYGHVKSLQKLLNVPESCFIPVVVFVGDATLRLKTKSVVLKSNQLNNYVETFKSPTFTADEVSGIIERINSANIESKIMRDRHVATIRKRIKQDEIDIERGICPKCGAELVKRTGRYGSFLGCSNFPKCRYTMNIE